MSRFPDVLRDARFLSFLGVAALSALLLLGAPRLQLATSWALAAAALLLLGWAGLWLLRRRKARRAGAALGAMLAEQADPDLPGRAASADIAALRRRLQDAVKMIKSSRLGQLSGAEALYELPWYITIGNPAAGKSTAIVNSGLQFPFDDGARAIVRGIGGTRNCDWFFTNEGILLDTAGRYAVHEEDRAEWLGFLGLLKKHRPRAPINGILVTVSILELTGGEPGVALHLARSLRQRVQELTETLEVCAPVYVLFTKADLIPGFHEFFLDLDPAERERVWGATLPYDEAGGGELISLFEQRFDELHEGLHALSVARLSRGQGEPLRPGVLGFPAEFAAIKPALRAFVATLFEDNPFQFKPVFRGFYLSSAIQGTEGPALANVRIAQHFGLADSPAASPPAAGSHGYFLRQLFSRVIFPDRQLVRRHVTPARQRLRQGAVLAALLMLGLALAGWSWSYLNNRSLLDNVAQDLAKVAKVQEGRSDLQSRLEALEILQERLAQLERFNDEHPLSLGLGLYQGREMAELLRREYFAGVSSLMLTPVQEALEAFLHDVTAPPEGAAPPPAGPALAQPYREARAADVDDAYNALKTYLMLAHPEHVDVGHLSDQITRFWRGWLEANRGTMSREQMIRLAGHVLSFHLAHARAPDWPLISVQLALVDAVRDKLRRVVRGMPAAERVYADIRARASTRFPPLTVAALLGAEPTPLLTGSHVVSGALTVEAWQGYVQGAIHDAAINAQQSSDWVLQSSTKDDLTLEGSPEQIQKTLLAMYKRDYAEEWKRFVQGLSVAAFAGFPEAVAGMNRLGDAAGSPLGLLLRTVVTQTAWDNPGVVSVGLAQARQGLLGWFQGALLSNSPVPVPEAPPGVAARGAEMPLGAVGREFAGFGRLVAPRNDGEALLDTYLKQLSKIRSRLNLLQNQGDSGPGALKLMRETLDGGSSELAEALRFVDEQMLTGMPEAQRVLLRPLLLRPLLQTYAAIMGPAADELNKTWDAQVYQPFQRKLALKYPFSPQAGIEAAPAEIAQLFGPDGAVARYVDGTLGALVVRRGNTITARTWGELGVVLQPEFANGFPRWVAALEGGAAGDGAGGQSGPAQTVFMLRPQPAVGSTGYVIEIDGQKLAYRNGPAEWSNFVWPNAGAAAGARLSATTFDGRSIDVVNIPGRFGLEKMINSAHRTRQPDGSFRLSWSAAGLEIGVDLRVVSSPQVQAGGASGGGGRGFGGLVLPPRVVQANGSVAAASPAAVRLAAGEQP